MKSVLILVDGLRPDAPPKRDLPFLHELIRSNRACAGARSVFPPVTLPCHFSIFTGATPASHGIVKNVFFPDAARPLDLFTLHKNAGKTSDFFHNWETLRDLSAPGKLRRSFSTQIVDPESGASDREVAAMACRFLREDPADFTFIYLGALDEVGHRHGWMSDPYLDYLHVIDALLADLMAAIPKEAAWWIWSDHGGHDKNHGQDVPEDMNVFALEKAGLPGPLPAEEVFDLTGLHRRIAALSLAGR